MTVTNVLFYSVNMHSKGCDTVFIELEGNLYQPWRLKYTSFVMLSISHMQKICFYY